ncbi:MAG: YcxB family protein [Bacteroidia bacterium]
METPIEVSGQITEQDYLRYNFLALNKRRNYLNVAYIILSGLMVFGLVYFLIIGTVANVRSYLSSLIPLLLILALLPLLAYLLTFFSAKRAFKKDTIIQKNRTYVFDQDGISCTTENAKVRYSWSDTFQFAESKNMYLIYLNSRGVFPLPKHFLTKEQEEQIRSLLKSSITTNKKWYPSWLPRIAMMAGIVAVVWLVLDYNDKGKNKSREDMNKGYQLELKGDIKGAMTYFDLALKEDPKNAVAYNNRGYCKATLGNMAGELEDCSKAIALDTAYANAYIGLGYARFAMGDSTGACEAFHKAKTLGDTAAVRLVREYCR